VDSIFIHLKYTIATCQAQVVVGLRKDWTIDHFIYQPINVSARARREFQDLCHPLFKTRWRRSLTSEQGG